MKSQTIGIKQLHKDLRKISLATKKGQSFVVFKHSEALFRIEPILPFSKKPYNLADLKNIQFFSGDRNLSKKIDKTVYGL